MGATSTYTFYLKTETGRYDLSSRIVLPRVSTILGKLAKPQLIKYTYSTTLELLSHGLVEAMGDPAKASAVALRDAFETLQDHELLDEWVRDNNLHPEDKLDVDSKRGQKAHGVLANLATIYGAAGQAPSQHHAQRLLKNERDPYARAVASFWQEREPKPLYSEKVVFSLAMRYAGRFDLLAVLPERDINMVMNLSDLAPEQVTMVDLKTRRAGLGLYDSDDLQTSAYKLAAEEMGLAKIQARAVLLAHDDETYELAAGWIPEDAWRRLVDLYYFGRKTEVR